MTEGESIIKDEEMMESDPVTKKSLTKKERKLIKERRRKHPDISKKILQLWENLRQKNGDASVKHGICEKIIKLTKEVIVDLLCQHATCRVFESVIEFGQNEHRWMIFELIKNDILRLCDGKYSNFVISSMLRHGTKEQRLSVYQILKGNITQLLQHVYGSKIVEIAYNEFATSSQRHEMIQEFYGKKFLFFKGDREIQHLEDLRKCTTFDLCVLEDIHKLLLPIFSKELTDLTIVQHLLCEYLRFLVSGVKEPGTYTKQYDSYLGELLDIVKLQLVKLCNTREGSKVSMMIYWYSTVKARKEILKSLKDFIVGLCKSPHGYLLTLAILDQTDDVQMLNKCILQPILSELDDVISNKDGRKVLQFILHHRSTTYFSKYILDLLKEGDGNPYSKKTHELRSKEVLESVSKAILLWLPVSVKGLLDYTNKIHLLTSILCKCIPRNDELKAKLKEVFSVIAIHIDEPMLPSEISRKRKPAKPPCDVIAKKIKNFSGNFKTIDINEECDMLEEADEKLNCHLLDSPAGQFLTRRLCKMEKEGLIDGFSSVVIETVHVDHLKTFIGCNRSAFFLVNLFECNKPDVQKKIVVALEPLKQLICDSSLPGVNILKKLLFEK